MLLVRKRKYISQGDQSGVVGWVPRSVCPAGGIIKRYQGRQWLAHPKVAPPSHGSAGSVYGTLGYPTSLSTVVLEPSADTLH